jgi:hypothetical protein
MCNFPAKPAKFCTVYIEAGQDKLCLHVPLCSNGRPSCTQRSWKAFQTLHLCVYVCERMLVLYPVMPLRTCRSFLPSRFSP